MNENPWLEITKQKLVSNYPQKPGLIEASNIWDFLDNRRQLGYKQIALELVAYLYEKNIWS